MQPLADKIRPNSLKNFVGQEHLVAKDKPIYAIIHNKKVYSMLFWGGSGVGKTTLARIIASSLNADFIEVSAVISTVADIRIIIENAKISQNLRIQTIVFIDEIHHFNKSRQDILLPHIESGLITLIGATTQNPSFAINNAILSRVAIFTFLPLNNEDLRKVLLKNINLSVKNQDLVLGASNGDCRKMLGIIERITGVDEKNIADFIGDNLVNFDNGGDEFYQQLSALHKSVRGSNPDAALYWYAKMLNGGADATIIARRLLAIASEDIGLADPRAMEITLNGWDIYHRVGKKEGERAIAQALIYCAVAPKSNAVYKAFNQVRATVKNDNFKVPKHLCNAPTKLLKELGFRENYKYDHDFEGGFAKGQTYFPKELGEIKYYHPVERGLEIKIKAKLDKLRDYE